MDIGLTVLTKNSCEKTHSLHLIWIVSYSEVDFILEINTRDDWIVEWLHVLCAIKVRPTNIL